MLQGIRQHREIGIMPIHLNCPYLATKIINKSKKYCGTNYFSRFFIDFYCNFNTFTTAANSTITMYSMIHSITEQCKISFQRIVRKYLGKLGRQISCN